MNFLDVTLKVAYSCACYCCNDNYGATMFMSDISIIVRQMRIAAERSNASFGIGFPEQLVLMHLQVNGTCNQESIACSLDIDKGAIAKTIAKLEDKGLVTREVNPKNKREKVVAMTAPAKEMLASMRGAYGDFEKKLFAGLSKEEIANLAAYVAVVARNVSDL